MKQIIAWLLLFFQTDSSELDSSDEADAVNTLVFLCSVVCSCLLFLTQLHHKLTIKHQVFNINNVVIMVLVLASAL